MCHLAYPLSGLPLPSSTVHLPLLPKVSTKSFAAGLSRQALDARGIMLVAERSPMISCSAVKATYLGCLLFWRLIHEISGVVQEEEAGINQLQVVFRRCSPFLPFQSLVLQMVKDSSSAGSIGSCRLDNVLNDGHGPNLFRHLSDHNRSPHTVHHH